MATTHAEFDRLVSRLECSADASPKLYNLRVFLLALLGYSFPAFLMFLTSLLVTISSVPFVMLVTRGNTHLLLVSVGSLLLCMYHCARAFFFKMPIPTGYEIGPQQAAPLFRAINEIRQKVHGQAIDKVILNHEFNASIGQFREFGPLSKPVNCLFIGLPLMQCFSADEFKAVLAHEFGHLSAEQSRFRLWIYQFRIAMYRLAERLTKVSNGNVRIYSRFFRWYVPFFRAYSLVLARGNEYDADQWSAKVTNPRITADALINVELYGAFYDEVFIGRLEERVRTQEEIPAYYTALQQAFRECSGAQELDRFLERALKRRTDSIDSHPCLRERLEALGQSPRIPLRGETSAAEVFFGKGLSRILSDFDKMWREAKGNAWKNIHEYNKQASVALDELQAKMEKETLSIDEHFQRAMWVEEVQGKESALPLYCEVLRIDAHYTPAMLAVGRIYLAQDNREGVNLLDQAIKLDHRTIPTATSALYEYMKGKGHNLMARKYAEIAADYNNRIRVKEAPARGLRLSINDSYVPHDLSSEDIDVIRRQLEANKDIAAAYLAMKEMKEMYNLGSKPIYVFCIKPQSGCVPNSPASKRLEDWALNTVSVPEITIFLIKESETSISMRSQIIEKIKEIYGAVIFTR